MNTEMTNTTTMHDDCDDTDGSDDVEDFDHGKGTRLRTRMAKKKTR